MMDYNSMATPMMTNLKLLSDSSSRFGGPHDVQIVDRILDVPH
jgi:hypothetical protein